jgi:ABC-type lipoprotein release transport system permease subunit
LFGVTTTDAVTYASVAGLLLIVAFGARLVPAERATKVEPVAALRCQGPLGLSHALTDE